MDHKEQVRIAVSKSLSRLLPLLNRPDPALFKGQLMMLYALIILLNDEQPDIRYFLCKSDSLAILWKEEKISLNDQYIVEVLFNEFTEKVLKEEEGSPELVKTYAVEYLMKQWILGNPYREHLAKNYEDKIFFFEPVNKFYDLLWVKRLAFSQLQKIV